MTKPLVLAHRGASAYAPENTLAAFRLAFEMGADGIELDVTLTRDRVPVVLHDDRVDRTTNGKGAIKHMTLAEVQRLDAGAWFNEKFRGEKVPTLDQVLAEFGTRGLINIELKSIFPRSDGIERAAAQVIERVRTAERVLISSFNPLALYRIMKIEPRWPRGLLYSPNLPIYLRRAWLRLVARPNALHPPHALINSEFVAWARRKGYKINTWTVDDPNEMKRLIALSVDAVMTNKPDILREVVDSTT